MVLTEGNFSPKSSLTSKEEIITILQGRNDVVLNQVGAAEMKKIKMDLKRFDLS